MWVAERQLPPTLTLFGSASMSIYTYIQHKSLCEALGIEFQEILELSDQYINDIPELDDNKVYQRLGAIAWKGQHHTEETKRKLSEIHKSIPKSIEHKKSLSIAAKRRYEDPSNHPLYGKKGKDNPKFGKHYGRIKKVECPHCKKLVASNNIKRYHYENCKWKHNAD